MYVSGMSIHEVELTNWQRAQIARQLAGFPRRDLQVVLDFPSGYRHHVPGLFCWNEALKFHENRSRTQIWQEMGDAREAMAYYHLCDRVVIMLPGPRLN